MAARTSGAVAAAPVTDDRGLPLFELAFPGPLRDRLVAAVLDGAKTSTTSTVVEYSVEDEPFPQVGDRSLVVDSDGRGVAVVEVTGVDQVRLADVPLQHALDEGEGYADLAQWRAGHEEFWHSTEMRRYLDDPGFEVGDDTMVVLERFRVVHRLDDE